MDLYAIYSFGINMEPDKFFVSESSFSSLNNFIEELAKDNKNLITVDSEIKSKSISRSDKTIFVPFFGNRFEPELKSLMENPRKSLLYYSTKRLLESIRKDRLFNEV